MQRLIIIWALEGGGQDNPGNRGKSAKWESNTPPQMRHQISHNTVKMIGLTFAASKFQFSTVQFLFFIFFCMAVVGLGVGGISANLFMQIA